MQVSYFRSSSLGTLDYCEMKYFIVYNLGIPDDPNIKTEMGTIVHCVMECLAGLKQSYDKTGKYEWEHESIGKLSYTKEQMEKPYKLSIEEVERINKSRLDKYVYLNCHRVPFGEVKYGVEAVSDILKKAYEYYSSKSTFTFTEENFKHCKNWTWMALEYANRNYDPRNRKIVAPEQPFEIEIKKDWAKFEYLIDDKKVKGNLAIKGTIDLITEIDEDTIEIVDWKSGQRRDWAKNKVKEYEDLMEDKQLMLYYYAARNLFPQYKNILITIVFIRDGGPFTLDFDDSVIPKVEKNLKDTFYEVKNIKMPKLLDYTHQDFRCNKLCKFFKQKVNEKSFCSHIGREIKAKGMDQVVKEYKKEGFNLTYYQNPGE